MSKQNGTDGPTPPAKRIRRSEQETFIFKKHCFLCGKVCEEVDPRHPNRWRPVSYCRTADRGSAQKTFKDVILDTCDSRNDEWGNRVKLRVHAAVSDLHAAYAMYHRDCLQAFKSNTDQSQNVSEGSDDDAFCKVLHDMLANKSRMWNAVEIQELYKSHGGELLSRRLFTQRLSNKLGPDFLVLSCVGVANILVFRQQASKHEISSEQ